MEIHPITPLIGAEVVGVSLKSPLPEGLIETLHDAWMTNQVLFFRDQNLSIDELRNLGLRFGELHIHPAEPGVEGHEGILRIHTDASSKIYAGRKWHSDVSCDREPPMGSILHLHEVPELGGDTLFASMYAAHDALSPAMQEFLQGFKAVHASAHNDRDYFGRSGVDLRDGTYPESAHPVVRTHPVTGRKALYVNETFTTHIEDLSPHESEALLGMLFRHIASPRFQCRFRWSPGAVAMWDNRCTQHLAIWDYHPNVRSGYRATICGDEPR